MDGNHLDDIVVNTDSAYEAIKLDFSLIKSEITSRTEFNRRALNLQVSLITGLLAAGLIKDFAQFDPFILQVVCMSVVLINAVFLLEINQNNFYIALAAQYLVKVLNTRSKSITGTVISDWECFLHVKRDGARAYASRLAFFLDAHFAMSVIFAVIPTTLLFFSIYRHGVHHALVLAFYALISYPINIFCMYRHFMIPREVGVRVTSHDVRIFKQVFHV